MTPAMSIGEEARLYGVVTTALNRQVKRNEERSPEDFMFRLSAEEWDNLKCQIGISSWGGDRQFPYAFTENVIAMLSGVLRSSTAIEIKMRSQFVTSNKVNFLCHLLRHESSFAKLPASTRQVLPKRRRAPAFGLELLHFMSESSARTFPATSPPNAKLPDTIPYDKHLDRFIHRPPAWA